MTDTLAHDTDHSTAAPAGHPAATLEHLDPHTLVLDANVRDDDDPLDPAFLANIKEHGVLVPIAAIRTEDGHTVVRMGQRRTLAARKAGLTTVPVYVRPAEAGDTAQLVQRVTEQIVENDQRRELSEAQRARGIQQLLDAGVSITKVAQKLSVKKDTVKAAQTVGTSDAAAEALAAGQLSLTEAAALAEFDGEADAARRLIAASGTTRFDHVVAQLREEKASRERLADAEKPYREQGFTVLDRRPRNWDINCVELRYLNTADDQNATTDAITDPALWAVLVYDEDGWVDRDTREAVNEDDIDWNTEGEPDAAPAEGLRHADSVEEATVWVAEYYCLDYAKAGLIVDAVFLRFAGIHDDRPAADVSAGDGAQDEAAAAARAQAQADAEAAKIEAERRQRRMVLALNRLGAAAEQVRRQFVTTLLTRKTPPKGAPIFTARCLTHSPSLISEHHADAAATELLGIGQRKLRTAASELPPTADARAQVITLGLILGALENRTPKDAWRQGGSRASQPWANIYGVGPVEYLGFLAANGYALSDVEQVMIGERSADEVYDATLADDHTPREPDTDDTDSD